MRAARSGYRLAVGLELTRGHQVCLRCEQRTFIKSFCLHSLLQMHTLGFLTLLALLSSVKDACIPQSYCLMPMIIVLGFLGYLHC